MSSCVGGNSQDPCYDVATIIDPPYVMSKAEGSDQYEGLVVDVLDRLSLKAKMRYRLKVVNGTYGHEGPQGTWTGLIGRVVTIPADMAAGAIAITPERERVLRFTETFHSSSVQLLLPRPTSDVGPGAGLLLAPFSTSAWVVVCLAFILVSVGLFLIGRFSPLGWKKTVPTDMRRRRLTHILRKSFLLTVSALTWQGHREMPKPLSGRVVVVSWWFFVLLILTGYLSNLTALVSLRPHLQPALTFRSYEDILRDRSVDVAMVRHGDAHLELGASRVTLEKQLSDYVVDQGVWVDSLAEGLQRMRDSAISLALLLPSYRARRLTSYHCDLITHGHGLGMINYAFGFPAGSFPQALGSRIDAAIVEMRESGELEKLTQKWAGLKDHCPDPEGSSLPVTGERMQSTMVFEALGPRDLAVPLVLLFICGLLAIGLEVWEFWKSKRSPKPGEEEAAVELGIKDPKQRQDSVEAIQVEDEQQVPEDRAEEQSSPCSLTEEENVKNIEDGVFGAEKMDAFQEGGEDLQV